MRISLIATFVALLTSCALPQVQAEPTETTKAAETKVVIMHNGEKRELHFSGANWRESEEWQAFIKELEPAQASRLEGLLASTPPMPPMPPMPASIEVINEEGIKHIVLKTADGELMRDRVIQVKAVAAEQRFSALKKLLESAELNKDQLLELQKILDSKH